MAVVSSLRSFDREQQKEDLVPIVIKDSGSPAMSGTSTLTIIIGDTNDNKMQPGSKEVLVYSYMVCLGLILQIVPIFIAFQLTKSMEDILHKNSDNAGDRLIAEGDVFL